MRVALRVKNKSQGKEKNNGMPRLISNQTSWSGILICGNVFIKFSK